MLFVGEFWDQRESHNKLNLKVYFLAEKLCHKNTLYIQKKAVANPIHLLQTWVTKEPALSNGTVLLD